MAIFKKRSDESEVGLSNRSLAEEKEGLKGKSQDIKNLKSENELSGGKFLIGRKKKEPKKPWGKKERTLILIVLLFTVGTSAVLSLYARNWKFPGLPRLAVPKLSIPYFGSKTFVIEGNKMEKEKNKKEVKFFNEKTKDLSGVYALYVIRLGNGSFFGVNEKELLQAASLIKLPVMAGMFLEAESGRLNLNSKYKLKQSDKVKGSGSLYSKPVGYEITYENLIRLMGKESDNTAFNICKNYLGKGKIEDIINGIGMENTSVSENTTTAEDIGVFFQELWNGNIVNKDDKEKFLDFITDTIYEDWLASGIPDGVRIAHKFGRELHVVNDAGIIFSNKPFVLVVLSKGVVENEADLVITEISKEIYEIETTDSDENF